MGGWEWGLIGLGGGGTIILSGLGGLFAKQGAWLGLAIRRSSHLGPLVLAKARMVRLGLGVQTVSRRYILMEWGRWGRSASISVAIDGFLYLETK